MVQVDKSIIKEQVQRFRYNTLFDLCFSGIIHARGYKYLDTSEAFDLDTEACLALEAERMVAPVRLRLVCLGLQVVEEDRPQKQNWMEGLSCCTPAVEKQKKYFKLLPFIKRELF